MRLCICLILWLACLTSLGCESNPTSAQPTTQATVSDWRRGDGICEIHKQVMETRQFSGLIVDPTAELQEAMNFFPNCGLNPGSGNYAKERGLIYVCTACVAGLEQFQTTPRPPLSERDRVVLEFVLREWLRGSRSDVVFLSVGSINTAWKDPPRELRQSLGDLRLEILPVSFARHPKDGEMESLERFRGVEDPRTGKRAKIYWAEIKGWASDTKVRVDTGVWSGPLGGGGSVYVLELKDGKWEIVDSEDDWVS